jgi:hypothetical protein
VLVWARQRKEGLGRAKQAGRSRQCYARRASQGLAEMTSLAVLGIFRQAAIGRAWQKWLGWQG